MGDPIRVLLVDDHVIMRSALRRSLAREFVVVGVAGDGEEALRVIAHLAPDVAVVDVVMQPMDGLELTTRLTQRTDAPAVVVLTGDTRANIDARSAAAGAFGCVLKSGSLADLRGVIRAAAEARRDRRAPRARRSRSRSSGVASLSTRELEVLALLADGYRRTQIAARLGISERTADKHRAAILRKLGITSDAEAARIAEHEGVVGGRPNDSRDG